MARRYPNPERRRHRIPLPPERRAEQGFVVDMRSHLVIAPWGSQRPLPGDFDRLNALFDTLDPDALPADVCWVWPDGRAPVPVQNGGIGWLQAWARDRAVYALRTMT